MGVLVPAVALAASAVVWSLVYRSLVAHPLDPVALVLYYLGLQLLFRPFVLVTGLDSPFPDDLFVARDVAGLVIGAQAVVGLWLVSLWAGARLSGPVAAPVSLLFPWNRRSLPPGWLFWLAVAASVVAAAVTAALWSRYGGPVGLIEASKVSRDVAESRGLRTLPLLAALLAVAAFLSAERSAHGRRTVALLLVVADSLLSFTWGARDVAVLSVVALLGGSLLFGDGARGAAAEGLLDWFRSPRRRRRLVLVGVAALVLAFGLRSARDTVLWGAPAPTISGETPVRQFAVATNNTFYDTLLLILDDWPDEYDFHGGSDFRAAAVAAAPTLLVGEQEPFVSPAVQVAQTYLDRNNGFPATAVGDWYLDLGLLGVVLGGLLSGLLARAAQLGLRRFSSDPFVWALSLVFMLRIFPGGLWATSLPKWVAIGVPLLAAALALDRLAAWRTAVARPGRADPVGDAPAPARDPVPTREPAPAP